MTESVSEPVGPEDIDGAAEPGGAVPGMPVETIAGSPEAAWKVLDSVNNWIKHAETKAAGTVATSGVAAGLLYTLWNDMRCPSRLIGVLATICAVLIACAGLSGAWALRPRLWSREQPTSNIYFDHIARRHNRKSGAAEYTETVRTLTADDDALAGEIAAQILANSHIARAKYRWASVGLTAVLLALAALAATALTRALTGW